MQVLQTQVFRCDRACGKRTNDVFTFMLRATVVFFAVCNIAGGVFMCKAYNKYVFTQAILPCYGDFLCMIFW